MIDPRNLTKKDVILNAEGPLLALYQNQVEKLFFGAYLREIEGYTYFPVTKAQLKLFFESKLTLEEIFNSNEELLIKRSFKKDIQTYLKDGIEKEINFYNIKFSEIPSGVKNNKIIDKYI